MLRSFKKKTITIDELKLLYKIYEHKDIVEFIDKLIKEGKLEAVKSSDKTPNYPQIHKKYRIIKEKEDNSEYISELNKLYFILSPSFYKKNIDLYKKHREYIKILNNYLINNNKKLDTQISVNERSYEIFTDEKFLMSDLGKEIATHLNLNIYKTLNVYPTPEPFCYYSISNKTPQNILIVENKDTYITIMKSFMSGNSKLLGVDISTVIYGEGYKIKSSFDYIYEDLTINYLNHKDNQILYWGDIDREGFIIYEVFKNKYNYLNIKLFNEAYDLMVTKSKNLNLSKIKNNQKQNYKKSLEELNNILKEDICLIIDNGNYIPQEILTSLNLGGQYGA